MPNDMKKLRDNFAVIITCLRETADEYFSTPEKYELTQEVLDQCDYKACSFAYACANVSMAYEFISTLHDAIRDDNTIITDVDIIEAYNDAAPLVETQKSLTLHMQQDDQEGYVFKDVVMDYLTAAKNHLNSYKVVKSKDENISTESAMATLIATDILIHNVYQKNNPDVMTRFELASAYNVALVLRMELQKATDPVMRRVHSEELSAVGEYFQEHEFVAPKHGMKIANDPFSMDTAQWAWEQHKKKKPLSSYFPPLTSG